MRHFILKPCILLGMILLLAQSVAATPEKLIPGGSTVAVQLQTDGVIVAELTDACKTKLKPGDQIIAVDGEPVTTVTQIHEKLNKTDGTATLTVVRGGKQMELDAQPIETDEGKRLGVSVRDRVGGIGTVTYYNPQDGTFGALGHGVNEIGTSQLIEISGGSVYPSQIQSVKKGQRGTPGQLQGAPSSTVPIGSVERNSAHGIFGTIDAGAAGAAAVEVADQGEITTGKATILSNVSGTQVEEYEVEILRLYPLESDTGRNICLRVTDPDLLAQTGGIVQGMSGSPILQNGKLVGAVTHVFVQEPEMGYGIFIENMLQADEQSALAA